MNGIRLDEQDNAHSALTLDDGTNPHGTTKSNVGLSNVDNTSDVNKPVSTAQAAANVTDRSRANHTGTQLSATISDFATTVRSTVLTGISFASIVLVTAADSILISIGKLQAQISAKVFGNSFARTTNTGTLTTSSAIFQEVVRLNAGTLTSGNYIVVSQCSFEKTLTAGKIECRFLLNGGSPQEVGHAPLPDDDYQYIGQFNSFYLSISGASTFSFQVRKSSGGGDIIIRNRQLWVYRVS